MMDLDEAVRLLAETTVIAPGSRLDEARQMVLAELEQLRAGGQASPRSVRVKQRMRTVEAGSTVVGYVQPRRTDGPAS